MNELTIQILAQFKERLQAHRLREGFKSADDFSVAQVVSPSSITKWEGKSHKQLFKAAKANDKTALEYLFYKMGGAIQAAFWKNYLGPSGSIRRYRIQADSAWEQWLSIAWMAMTEGFSEIYNTSYKGGTDAYTATEDDKSEHKSSGALEKFDIDKTPEKHLLNVFASRYKNILRNAAINANTAARVGGMTGREITGGSAEVQVHQYEPTWAEDGKDDTDWGGTGDYESTSSRGYKDETFDIAYEEGGFRAAEKGAAADAFLTKWKQFSQDPGLQQNTKGVTAGMIFGEVIGNKDAELRKIGVKFGISRNSAQTLLTKAQEVMTQHAIPPADLFAAIKYYGNEKVASYLSAVKATGESPKKTEAPKEQQTAGFMEAFSAIGEDPGLKKPSKAGVSRGRCLSDMVRMNFPTAEKLSDKYGISEKDAQWWIGATKKFLKGYGITEADLKSAIKEYGKKEILTLIK